MYTRIMPMLFMLSLATTHVRAEQAISVKNAWIREAPSTAKVLAGYLEIINDSGEKISLIRVQSPEFDHVMIHKTEIVDGVARMLHSNEISIPGHSSFLLSPGGYHLMMVDKKRPLIADDYVEITLYFKQQKPVIVNAKVKKDLE